MTSVARSLSNAPSLGPLRTTYANAFGSPDREKFLRQPHHFYGSGTKTAWRPRTRVSSVVGANLREQAEPTRSQRVSSLATSTSLPALPNLLSRSSSNLFGETVTDDALTDFMRSNSLNASHQSLLVRAEQEVRRFGSRASPVTPCNKAPSPDPVAVYVLLKNGKMHGRQTDNTAYSPPRVPKLW